MSLSAKKCIACSSDAAPLGDSEISNFIEQINGWSVANDKASISKEFKFKNFAKAIEFVNKVGAIAESESHHPDIEFGWGYCKVNLSTHSICGLHENDFIVAAKINEIEA